MDFIADLHLHSRYSRAVSQEMNLSTMSDFARKKGIQILTTGDWTHPVWFREIRSQLAQEESGLYTLKNQGENREKTYFLLTVEISCIFSQGGKGRRIHNLVFTPNFETAEKVNQELLKRGANLSSDGRPIIGMSSKQLLELLLEIDEKNILIPAHIWTPWFGLFGANSGFDTIEESFQDLSQYIFGIETGLSSDPEMNWQIKELDSRAILSFSDAHSAPKMGREATVFRLNNLSYDSIRSAIMSQGLKIKGEQSENTVLYTIEFYPEEGKYHYNGHRNCGVYQSPEETRKSGENCPICHRRITVGVMQRVEDLSSEIIKSTIKKNNNGLRWLKDPKGIHPPFIKMVPLNEIIAESIGASVASLKVKSQFDSLCDAFGSEVNVLLKTPIADLEKNAGERIAEGISKVREGDIYIQAGYDNVYGTVKIWHNKESNSLSGEEEEKKDQLGIDF